MELSVEQIRIIDSKMNGHCLIKGVAGSGKTTVALCKVIKFLKDITDKNEKILMVTYNNTLIQYMKWLSKIYQIDISSEQIEIKTIDSIIFYYARDNKRKLVSSSEQRKIMQWAIQKVKKQFGEECVVTEKNQDFLTEEIEWMKSCHYTTREEYLNVDRVGRFSIGENKMRLQKQSADRDAIFSLYELYETELEKRKLTDFKTNALLVKDLIGKQSIKPKKYKYIIVDESQDLTRVQLEIIRELYQAEGGSILFIADVAQSIYPHSWLSKQSFKSVGFDMSGKSNILSKNFRTTKQIAMAAYTLLNHDHELKENMDYVEPIAVERNGMKPKYRSFSSEVEEFSFVTGEIKKLISQYDLKDMAIVARNHAYLKKVETYLFNHGVDAVSIDKSKKALYFEEDKVSLFTLHAIKGLEFPVVFIVGMNFGVFPYPGNQIDVERKLLYVGMTRAKNILYLSNSGVPSVFIKEIDKKYLNLEEEKESYYEISVEKYHGGDHISATEEERVRQWYIEQLKLTYGYPGKSIELEYPLQYGSRKYFVDLVVYRETNARKRPYLMIEVKKENADLEEAMKQLESYLVPGNVPEYIAVVNGRNRIVKKVEKILVKGDIDFRLEPVDDIPSYQEKKSEIFRYMDVLHKREYEYRAGDQDKTKLLLVDLEKEEQEVEGTSLQMLGNVAAGTLKYINASAIEEVIVPSLILANTDMLFSLTVEGDSMVDFGIFDQDKIIVKRQSNANVGDLVVAGNTSTDEITLKQFFYDGESVILHPGNKKYQDIRIDMQDFFINGVVIGIVHKME